MQATIRRYGVFPRWIGKARRARLSRFGQSVADLFEESAIMKKVLLAAALTAVCGVAAAQGYAGALIGLGKLNADCTGSSCDTSDTAFKLYGGYEVAPDISVEFGYTDFGTYKLTGTYNNVDISAISVSAAFRGNLAQDLTGVARLGLASVKSEWDLTNPGSKSKIGIYAGLGLEYNMTTDIKLTGAFDLTNGEVNGDTGAVYLFGVGAQVGF